MSGVYGPTLDPGYDPTTAAENQFLDFGTPVDSSSTPNATPLPDNQFYDTSGNIETLASNQNPYVSSNSTGSGLLGWLGLANNIAQTAIGAAKGSNPITARPRTTTSTASNSGIMLLLVGLFAVLLIFGMERK